MIKIKNIKTIFMEKYDDDDDDFMEIEIDDVGIEDDKTIGFGEAFPLIFI